MIFAFALLALQPPAAPASVRTLQRQELERGVAKTNGLWKLREWGHFFVLSDVADERFFDELERQAFTARETCVRLFPEAGSDPVRDDRRLPVLRACADADEYWSYGGPAGSNAYWSSTSGELVVHATRDRSETWFALAGCIAGEFLDEFFGEAPRADWFELGLSQHCACAVRASGLPAGDLARWPTLEELLSAPQGDWLRHLSAAPDRRFVAWTWMRFLCDETLRGQDFDPRWALIPERYAIGWFALKDEARARAFAFEGLDRAALERAWRASVPVR